MAITSAMFDSSNLGNQSTNINHIASQGKGFLLDGMGADAQANTVTSSYGITGNQSDKLSSSYSANTLAQSSAKVSAGQSAKYFAGLKYETLSYPNPDIPSRGEITPFKGFMVVTTRGRIEYCQPINDRRVEFSESIKKGSVSATRFAQLSDCLALRCLRLISPCNAVTINCPVLSSGSFNNSTLSAISCGTRASSFFDFAFIAFVAMSASFDDWWLTVYTKNNHKKGLTWLALDNNLVADTSTCESAKTATPRSARDTIEAFNHNVNWSNTMAMYKSTQTHPEFTWRFAECQENKATYHHVTAHTEDEARSLLPNLPLVFTARIRQEGRA